MTSKEYLRTALQPYKSTKLVDIPISSAPTSGAKIEGDQRFPSVKDFAEYILKYGIEGKQAPSGNLWINGANIGAYEYYYAASSLSITTIETAGVNAYSSADRNKCFFMVVKGNISLSPGLAFYTGTTTGDVRGKKLTCIYAKGNISNGSLTHSSTYGDKSYFEFEGSGSSDQILEDITIVPFSAGEYLYPRISKTGHPIYAQAYFVISSAYSSVSGTSAQSKLVPDPDGKMYFGNGGSGMSASVNSVGGLGAAGFRATAFGGGGGGGGAYATEHFYMNGGNAVFGSSGMSSETGSKGGETITVTGGGGMPQGGSIDPSPSRITSRPSRVGGSGIVFATGKIANIFFSAYGGGSPYNSNYANAASFVGGGGSGGGLVFSMAQEHIGYTGYHSVANTGPGGGAEANANISGGTGSTGAFMAFYGAYF